MSTKEPKRRGSLWAVCAQWRCLHTLALSAPPSSTGLFPAVRSKQTPKVYRKRALFAVPQGHPCHAIGMVPTLCP